MKKMILPMLLVFSKNAYAEDVIATATYDNEKKEIIMLRINSIDENKLNKCSKTIDNQKGRKMLKNLAKRKKGKIVEINFTCKI
ncbi:hypothetical protein DCO44_07450 [Acinetobacter sp. AM]|uniref:hypothetical protein n=1 Tax=Acinetobacter sp. AM TaxID=2170730 RepID=UPI000DE5CABD|nr:hypothetical protein [Acinetobacter sp. AM]PWB14872.1 hypothetical protein DCO44_07450 [Acinetobacter sp. AM]